MSEIVVSEPINDEQNGGSPSGTSGYTTNEKRPFTRSLISRRNHGPEPFDSEKLPVTLISGIQRFFRVANLIEIDEPRVAYLCRFYAFEVAHSLDRSSSGRGVRQFKTSLLQRLDQDNELTFGKGREKSDFHELRRVYRQYKDYIGEETLETREKLMKARAIASVLFEVLKTGAPTAGSQSCEDLNIDELSNIDASTVMALLEDGEDEMLGITIQSLGLGIMNQDSCSDKYDYHEDYGLSEDEQLFYSCSTSPEHQLD